jgi:hypothetical protein
MGLTEKAPVFFRGFFIPLVQLYWIGDNSHAMGMWFVISELGGFWA